jgi:superkiller protein 3
VHLYPPRYHSDALNIIEEVLTNDPRNVSCLMGRGFILQAAGKWAVAAESFNVARTLTDNTTLLGLNTQEEYAWCIGNSGDIPNALEILHTTLDLLQVNQDAAHDVARCTWRIGAIHWRLTGA